MARVHLASDLDEYQRQMGMKPIQCDPLFVQALRAKAIKQERRATRPGELSQYRRLMEMPEATIEDMMLTWNRVCRFRAETLDAESRLVKTKLRRATRFVQSLGYLWVMENCFQKFTTLEDGTRRKVPGSIRFLDDPMMDGPNRPNNYQYIHNRDLAFYDARIRLRVLDCRLQAVQVFEDGDLDALGVPFMMRHSGAEVPDMPEHLAMGEMKDFYRERWDSMNVRDDRKWATNPIVWVLEFELDLLLHRNKRPI